MGFYQVNFKIGKNGKYVYPKPVQGIVWASVHYNEKDNSLIAETNSKVAADGVAVILLAQADAMAKIAAINKQIASVPSSDPIIIKK